MNYADIKQYDIANGPGIRISIFVSGCKHACPGCFNQEAWDFSYGNLFTEKTIEQIIKYMEASYISGLTVLGGEPFELENQRGLLPLLRRVRQVYKEKNIWCFTGYLFDKEIMQNMYEQWEETREILSYLDVLVDGKFEQEKKDFTLRFKGSSNQRSILVQESLKEGKIVLWNPDTYPV